jgi:hypothetical protein
MKTSMNLEYAKLMVHEYGKNSLRKTVDNLSDVFLALRSFLVKISKLCKEMYYTKNIND